MTKQVDIEFSKFNKAVEFANATFDADNVTAYIHLVDRHSDDLDVAFDVCSDGHDQFYWTTILPDGKEIHLRDFPVSETTEIWVRLIIA